ncbi:YigZ family protein [Anaerocolumna cellulosilytica]|uniref:YigZ family protein n=1 Tax=Anaerocolumna cellulosilytica TaxID=433286 RepID=A0A6S6QZQ6_9FIRM|nr:YigZ family protein [Anaerocolumna cellulosilytica]MBB5195019.1 putative YigZ family protein [Anaerocolumna cellulosilytica]BCJ96144.1 YigZ family protein [Anaerocolumna cellulosilytica]
MPDIIKSVHTGGVGEIIEKKSRFIATVWPIDSEETALLQIEAARKKYWDASHNCYAYVLGFKDEIQRCSDDGEPAKTAGRPILDIIIGEQIHNVLIIVTRYFGGTLLGTGGLVRAYQDAAKEGLKESVIIEKIPGKKAFLTTDYTCLGKLQYLIGGHGVHILDSNYADSVTLHLLIPNEIYNEFSALILDTTGGKVILNHEEDLYYAKVSGEIMLFDRTTA